MRDGLVYIEGKYIALNGHFQLVTGRVPGSSDEGAHLTGLVFTG